jgi:hypothetical protein
VGETDASVDGAEVERSARDSGAARSPQPTKATVKTSDATRTARA